MNIRQRLAAIAFYPLSLISEDAKSRLRQSAIFPLYANIYFWLGGKLGPGLYIIQGGPARGLKIWVEPSLGRGYLAGLYEPGMTRAIQDYCRPGMIACDIGAHNGYFTLIMAKAVGPSGQCIAFEPSDENASHLRSTVAANGLLNVQVEEMAVGAETGEAVFLVHSLSSMGRLDNLVANPDRNAFVNENRIQVVSLDIYAETHGLSHVDFIKLDVEGAERLAIQGSIRILQQYRPILLIEVHTFAAPEVHARPFVVELQELGYSVMNVDSGQAVVADSFAGGAILAFPITRDGNV